ncbi:hypothetical protein C1N53_07285 [Pontibacter sp. SGAir0037]|nr:hypothetical protein C1N53_07285 [Pontibacter sp. SGAir0037]
MQVPEEEYFNYIIPGVILYHLGLLLPVAGVKDIPKTTVNDLHSTTSLKTKAAYYLIDIGFISSFASAFAPAFLIFFLHLLSQLKFIGCFYLYTSNTSKKIVLYIVFGSLVLDALAAAMFHDLLLWGLFFLFIFCIKNKVSLTKRYSALLLVMFSLLVLQSVKYQFRNVAWSGSSLSTLDRTELFFGMVKESLLSPGALFDSKANVTTITRLNQGWIISRVMTFVPNVEPFAEGETIEGAFSAALLPRFISENKAMAGGRVMMERFTGIILQEGTSMNISLIGEAYGNYGKERGMLFMFFIGLVYSFMLRYIFLKCRENPTLLLWIPFLFLQVIKAETDLTTTLNYLTKAAITMFIVFYGFRKVLKLEL